MTVLSPLKSRLKARDAFDVRIVQWSFLRRLMTPRQRRLYEYWLAGSGADGTFALASFDPIAVWDSVGYLHILQYHGTREDFFYRLSGDISTKAECASFHRRWVKDHPGAAGAKLRAHYLDVMASGRPWLGEVYADDRRQIAPYWNRMVLPMVDPRTPGRFTCLTLAEPQDTLPVPTRACGRTEG
jgi:hypothetical protein